MDTSLLAPQGQFHLRRLPRNHAPSLRAWDAADEYLLAHLAEQSLPAADSRVLIVNDAFGALAVALASRHPQSLSDSWLAHQATRNNLAANGRAADAVTLHGSLDSPDGPIDLLLIKLPKTLALLEDELHRLRPRLAADCRIIDESVMAIASARDNFQCIHPGREASFRLGDGLNGVASESADLILCNPPFHQQQAIGDQIALAMFRQARRVLRQDGELWVVGNRHLGYHQSLGRLFGRVETVASNRKFVVLHAQGIVASDRRNN